MSAGDSRPKPWSLSDAYREYARHTRELHRLTMDGKFESPEADAVRDASDKPWYAMSEVEQDRVAGLSGDLCLIEDPPVVPKPMTPQAWRDLTAAMTAFGRGEWDAALDRLRSLAAFAPPSTLARMRGEILAAAGDPESASLFLAHADRLDSIKPEAAT